MAVGEKSLKDTMTQALPAMPASSTPSWYGCNFFFVSQNLLNLTEILTIYDQC